MYLKPVLSLILPVISMLELSTSFADENKTYVVSGIDDVTEIVVDEFGVPHIYAENHYDVFFAQGFNAARDRLWQIDLWKRRGLGQLSEILGEQYLEQDRAARMFIYRGDMYAEWLAYGNDAKLISKAFTAGINAFVELAKVNPELMPVEFGLLGYQPSTWQADEVVRIRSNGLWRNVVSEVWRARLACEGKLEEAAQWRTLEPNWQTHVPTGLDPCLIPEDVLDNYLLAKAPVDFKLEHTKNSLTSLLSREVVRAHNQDVGSNNWVVSGARSNTGRPILADDPHRAHAIPSLRYVVHLNAPGINVIGAGEPALPGVSIGHNDKIAFGLTIFPIDQEDLYVYKKKSGGYLYKGRVEPFFEIEEKLEVRDGEDRDIKLKFTRHGPVIAQTKEHAFAVRAAWLEPGMAPYFGSIEYMRAENYREFISALNRWGAPSENQVYADVDGNIGYKPVGRFPKRDNWDGLMPVPGDGTYEWDGYFDMDVLPEEYNPARGFTGTANALSLPKDYPIAKYKVGFEWSAPWRYKRLWEYLQASNTHSMEDSLALQRDYLSVLARNVLALLPDLATSNPETGGPLLASWDHRLKADSAAAALWNVWYYRHLSPTLGRLVLDRKKSPQSNLSTQQTLKMLATPQGKSIAIKTLQSAWQDTVEKLGPDSDVWQWGHLHKIALQHPLLHLANPELAEKMRVNAYPRGGSANTTNNNGFGNDTFDVRSGASFRIVMDVGNWDEAKMTNVPGQSGDPRSRFYDNLLENWATDSHVPLLFSRERVEEGAVKRITLVPAI